MTWHWQNTARIWMRSKGKHHRLCPLDPRVWAITLWRASRLSMASPAGVFALGFLAQFLLFATSESIIAAQNSILWATYAFVGAKLALGVRTSQSITPLSTAPSVGAARTAPASTARTASSSIRSAGAP